ncbi:hypothetical protein K0M31_009751 [Melipona bicolor]|uniref:Uncharacterized protein n=1 Tax=Melipona bicolor TaxID=60889 RepID=A0AA40FN28_9HYME|nr:hypothetical protein K0M31_009751 [Melipona bicolor]
MTRSRQLDERPSLHGTNRSIRGTYFVAYWSHQFDSPTQSSTGNTSSVYTYETSSKGSKQRK